MKVPWKYRKVSANEFDRIHFDYKSKSHEQYSAQAYYGPSLGSGWYRKGMNLVEDIFKGAPHHWTRGIPCCNLEPGKDIVDCLAGVYNGRGRLSWLVGKHYVGMCPFKTKWRVDLKIKSLFGKTGR